MSTADRESAGARGGGALRADLRGHDRARGDPVAGVGPERNPLHRRGHVGLRLRRQTRHRGVRGRTQLAPGLGRVLGRVLGHQEQLPGGAQRLRPETLEAAELEHPQRSSCRDVDRSRLHVLLGLHAVVAGSCNCCN